VPCVDGSELAGTFFTSQVWSVQPCVRPVDAVHMTAGHNALRGSGPGQKHAFDNALAHVGWLLQIVGPQQHPLLWHLRAGGGAVHSIKSGSRRPHARGPLPADNVGLPEFTVAVCNFAPSCRKAKNCEYSRRFRNHPGNSG
jgi:hypothetical protein